MSVDELARELEVSRRTVFRDLNMLEMAHIPYYFDRDRSAYRIASHFFLPPVNLTLPEALAMMVMVRRRKTASAMPWSAHATRAAMKLESALPEAVRTHVGSMLEHMEIIPAPLARHEGLDAMLDDLTPAVGQRLVCELAYDSFYDRKQIRVTVHPLRLTFVQRAWYLLAWSQEHKEVRTFKLGRIKKLTVLEQTFSYPDDKAAENHFGAAWSMIPEGTLHKIHLLFAPQVAGNVAEVQWHASQQVQWRDDGSLDFHAEVDGLGEISWWILGYGDKVRVLAPAELACRVRETTQRAADQYLAKGV